MPAPEQKSEIRQPPALQGAQRGSAKRAEKDTAPHSEEAEQGILSSMMVDPECIPVVQREVTPFFFYSPVRKTIFEALLNQFHAGEPTDFITLTQVLRDRGVLEQVGGASHITELFTFIPTAVNIHYYIGIVREKFLLREMITAGSGLVRAAHGSGEIDIQDMLANFGNRLERMKKAAGGPNGMERFALSDLAGFDAAHDPNCLVGRRWLVRGGSCLMAGTAGIGKSTIAMQLAIYWAAGETVFGPRPVRALKSLIIQAEDDKGDVSEQYSGVLAGIEATEDLDFAKCRASIEKNLVIYRCAGYSGGKFLSMLDELAELEKPDLIWVNPLFSFAGCDLMNAKETGGFLREGLFPIGTKRGACIMVIHHIGKPAKKDGPEMPIDDVQYLGFGTSEIQNAFRAINVIAPDKKFPGVYKFSFSKRGSRAGAKTPAGEFTQTVYLKHSKEGLCWLQIPEPKEKAVGRQAKFSQDDVLMLMSFDKPATAANLHSELLRERDMSRRTFFNLLDELKEEGKIVKKDGGWIISKERENDL
jgi:hypothetical protein